MNEAHKNIESVEGLEKLCTDVNNLALSQETPVAFAIGYMAESIRRCGEYAADISENVINILMENDIPAGKSRPGKQG